MNIGVKGIVRVTVREADGTLVSEKIIDNIETNYAIQSIAKWLSGIGTDAVIPPSQIGAGNGTGTAAATDTALWSPIAGTQRHCDQILLSQGYYAQYNLQYQTSDPEGYYNELGLFDANNVMWAHVAINQYKSSSQTLTAQWMIYVQSDSSAGAAVTNYACTAIASWMTGTSNVSGVTGAILPPSQMHLGLGTGAVASSDTTLFSEVSGSAKNLKSATVVQNTNVQFIVTYVDGDPSGQFNEAGLFDSAGNMFVHGLINISRSTGNIMPVICQVNLSQVTQ